MYVTNVSVVVWKSFFELSRRPEMVLSRIEDTCKPF